MKKMNIGLVGAGFMGKAHMVAFSNMPKLFTDAGSIFKYAKTFYRCAIHPCI